MRLSYGGLTDILGMKLLAIVYYIKEALLYRETFDREMGQECLNWCYYGGGAFIKVVDSEISIVCQNKQNQEMLLHCLIERN